MPKKKWMSLVAMALMGSSLNFSMAQEPTPIDKLMQSVEQDLVSELNEDSPVAHAADVPAQLTGDITQVEASTESQIEYGNGQFYQTYDGPLYRSYTAVEGKPGTNRSLGD